MTQAHVPTLEEDMKNNPGRTRAEVERARRLWDTGMLEIRQTSELDIRFANRAAICAVSGRFEELSPSERSWPIISWKKVIKDWSLNEFGSWEGIDAFLAFVYTGGTEKIETRAYAFSWILGAALICPSYQNLVFKQLADEDRSCHAVKHSCETQTAAMNSTREALSVQFQMAKYSLDGGSTKLALISYIVDKYPWGAMKGDNASWEDLIESGGALAKAVAIATVKADESDKPRSLLPPWDLTERNKYLVDETLKPFKSAEIVRDGGCGSSATPKFFPSNKRPRTDFDPYRNAFSQGH